MRLWLIDAGYLFNAQRCAGQDDRFGYLKLRINSSRAARSGECTTSRGRVPQRKEPAL